MEGPIERSTIPALRRSSRLPEYVTKIGESNDLRTVPIDPTRLNDHLERDSFRAWEESQTENSWTTRA